MAPGTLHVPLPNPRPKSAPDDFMEPSHPLLPPPTCTSCGQLGHKTHKSKRCPNYVVPKPKAEGGPDEEDPEEEEEPDEEDLFLLKQQQQGGRKRIGRLENDAAELVAQVELYSRPPELSNVDFDQASDYVDSPEEELLRARSLRVVKKKCAVDEDFDDELGDEDGEPIASPEVQAPSDPSASIDAEGSDSELSEERRSRPAAAIPRKRQRYETYEINDSSSDSGGRSRMTRKSGGGPVWSKRQATAHTPSGGAATGAGVQSTAEWPGPASGGSKKQRIDGRALLKSHLDEIIGLIRQDKNFAPFDNPVPKAAVPDYNVFVPEKSEMWLRRIREKTRRYG